MGFNFRTVSWIGGVPTLVSDFEPFLFDFQVSPEYTGSWNPDPRNLSNPLLNDPE